ncbi:hypothetical protein ACH4OW_33250 [Streptomyces sp. NPDC017056]|uniref:hypothetical protein n=1 Tax=Streptomyces sp. NPDC017056 TaxID=3364973 RepID=UPI003791C22B
MSHRTALRHVRNAAAATVIAVAAFGLTACQDSGGLKTSSSSSAPTDTQQSPASTAKGGTAKGGASKGGTAKGGTAKGGASKGGTAKGDTSKGGASKDTSPKGGTPAGTPKKSGVKCTDQVNYADDPRSNAEINSIGEDTGYCPPIQHK